MKKTYKGLLGLILTVAMFFTSGMTIHAEGNIPNIYRHEGYSRENVAENVAKEHFSDAKKVIIVNRDKFPDAISATNISQGRYPVLYTHEDKISKETIDLMKSMPLDEIYILGGILSVNESVIAQLTSEINVPISRVAGRSRYDANVSAVRTNFNQSNHVIIASGEVFADALYGVSYANTINAPVILMHTNNLADSTKDLLKDLQVKEVTIIGGELTVTPEITEQLEDINIDVHRIAGRNRYIGSAQVANASYPNPDNIVVASGEVFTDALVSAPIAQKLDAPILLTRTNEFDPVVEEYLNEKIANLKNAYVQGGPLTISYTIFKDVLNQKEEDLNIVTADGSKVDIGLLNFEMLKLINEERVALDVTPLVYSPELQQGANIRAKELAEDFSYTRPDGSNFTTIHSNINMSSFTERIASYPDLNVTGDSPILLARKYADYYFNRNKMNTDRYNLMIDQDITDFSMSMHIEEGDSDNTYLIQHFGRLNK